ncbi:bZIP transcription factor [uncultured Endozoicomonas sp.]|uniref:bZIP transcription factor n=1 Tax=uncultured Endozoicomonas sp. TaxID=432652 RepID=UPI002624E931|nr:bZIP transcription factor [uncultured Endozoicomonas sp.]
MYGFSSLHGTRDKRYQIDSGSGLNADGGVEKASDYCDGRWNDSTVHIVPVEAHNSYNVVGMGAFKEAGQQFPVSVPVAEKHTSSAPSLSLNMPPVAKAPVLPTYNQAIGEQTTLNNSYPGAECENSLGVYNHFSQAIGHGAQPALEQTHDVNRKRTASELEGVDVQGRGGKVGHYDPNPVYSRLDSANFSLFGGNNEAYSDLEKPMELFGSNFPLGEWGGGSPLGLSPLLQSSLSPLKPGELNCSESASLCDINSLESLLFDNGPGDQKISVKNTADSNQCPGLFGNDFFVSDSDAFQTEYEAGKYRRTIIVEREGGKNIYNSIEVKEYNNANGASKMGRRRFSVETSMPEKTSGDHSAQGMKLLARGPVTDLTIDKEDVPSTSSLTKEEKYKLYRIKNNAASRSSRQKNIQHIKELEAKIHELEEENKGFLYELEILKKEKDKLSAVVHLILGIKK